MRTDDGPATFTVAAPRRLAPGTMNPPVTISPQPSPAPSRLPIGIQTFRKMREGGHYYVDKTPHIERLVESGSTYFLSRPRRFGKSLLVDTLKELFEGGEELFRGLAIHPRWDWSVRHPVLKLDFAGGSFSTTERLESEVAAQLSEAARRTGVAEAVQHPGDVAVPAATRLRRVLEAMRERCGRRVVVLVDEYDKPILDNLRRPEVARSNRDFLSGLYGTFKACDAHIRFLMLTGVSKFSKVNLFSGLNNLKDITLDPRFATICGYTDGELDRVFAPELKGLDRDAIREWYNGYRWLGEPVYNPFDVLLMLDTREFGPHWFETGTPTFLLDLLARENVASYEIEDRLASGALLSSFDVGRISPEALMFQTGYLTIVDSEFRAGRRFHRLGCPNREVRLSLHSSLLAFLTDHRAPEPGSGRVLEDVLRDGDFAALESEIRVLFAGIPYEWHTRNELARYEGYYASVFHSFLVGSGLRVRVEDSSAAGRLDLAVEAEGTAFLFELKVAERASAGAALAQLRKRGYAEKYRRPGRSVRLVGIHFSEKTRNIVEFEVAEG